jgi:hypothetical protein
MRRLGAAASRSIHSAPCAAVPQRLHDRNPARQWRRRQQRSRRREATVGDVRLRVLDGGQVGQVDLPSICLDNDAATIAQAHAVDAAVAGGEELVAGHAGAEAFATEAVDERRNALRGGRAEDVALEQRLAVRVGEDDRDRRAEGGAGHGRKRRHIANLRSWSRPACTSRTREGRNDARYARSSSLRDKREDTMKNPLTRGQKRQAGPKAGITRRPSRARLRCAQEVSGWASTSTHVPHRNRRTSG